MRKRQVVATLMFVFGVQSPIRANELKVVDVRRNIPLRDEDPVYRDFYINGGAGSGLKPNLVVTAVRKTTIRDPSGMQALGEMNVPVGQLRVIFVQDNIAVAREFKSLSRDDLPMLEQIGIMSGDILDLKGSFIEKRKPDSAALRPTDAASAVVAAATRADEKNGEKNTVANTQTVKIELNSGRQSQE